MTTFVMFRNLFFLICISGGVLPSAFGGEAAGYVGKKLSVNIEDIANGTVYEFSIWKKTHGDIELSKLGGEIVTTKKRGRVFLLVERHLTKYGSVDWLYVKDAVDIPEELQLSGLFGENPCESEKYPDDTIFAVGKWVNNKSESGRYAGGHAGHITKAWRIDFDAEKFREIPTSGVKCEDVRTEEEFN